MGGESFAARKSRSRGWEAFSSGSQGRAGTEGLKGVTRPAKLVVDREAGCLSNVKDSFYSEGSPCYWSMDKALNLC